MRIGNDATGQALARSLDLLSRRQQISSANLANVDTPGYKAKEVSFGSELGRTAGTYLPMTVSNALHLQGVGPRPDGVVVNSTAGTLRNDGNNVDVERELASLSETTITYNAVAQQVSARLALLRRVLTEGRS